jgi:hypothetical protein
MPVTALPDLPGGINARARGLSAVVALVNSSAGWNGTGSGPRISTQRQGGANGWNMPTDAILIEAGKGGGEDTPGLLWERVDFRCYGSGNDLGTRARNGHLVWRTLHFFICPAIGSGRASGFAVTASGALVIVTKVALEGGPLRLTEPDETWPYTWASYRFTYNAEAGA